MAAYLRLRLSIAGMPFVLLYGCEDRYGYLGHPRFPEEIQTGIKTPQIEVDLIRERLKRLKEALQ